MGKFISFAQNSENGRGERRNACKDIGTKRLQNHRVAKFCGVRKKKGSDFIPNLNLYTRHYSNSSLGLQANSYEFTASA